MVVTHLALKNWRNFSSASVDLANRAFVIGVNASGKSNFLDIFRFLRDLAIGSGGGLEKAVADRGGIRKLRALSARREPEIVIDVTVRDDSTEVVEWRYLLAFKSEGKGRQRIFVAKEAVWKNGNQVFSRPDEDDLADPERLTQTFMQQVNANKDFRDLVGFFSGVTYLHLVPQLLKYPEKFASGKNEDDPFGQGFLQRVAESNERVQKSRLKRIEKALKVCVPKFKELRFERDEIDGKPHLLALYEHWRPHAGWQREDQFSDGTLRLLGLMWSLLDGDGLLLLEEPELSLNDGIVKNIPTLIAQMQKEAKHKRQVIITTHSEVLLSDPGIDPSEVVRLSVGDEGTTIESPSETDITLMRSGLTAADVLLSKVRPSRIHQLDLWAR
jgi:predicted ATPase